MMNNVVFSFKWWHFECQVCRYSQSIENLDQRERESEPKRQTRPLKLVPLHERVQAARDVVKEFVPRSYLFWQIFGYMCKCEDFWGHFRNKDEDLCIYQELYDDIRIFV